MCNTSLDWPKLATKVSKTSIWDKKKKKGKQNTKPQTNKNLFQIGINSVYLLNF